MAPLSVVIRAKIISDGYFDLKLKGQCMEPLLMAGDKARIVAIDELRIGDIVLVSMNEYSLALHRVVSLDSGRVVTKGDYSGKAEERLQSDFIGVAKEFSLEGSPWVSDVRSKNEINSLALMSLGLLDRSDDQIMENRALIWAQNEAARAKMIEEGTIRV